MNEQKRIEMCIADNRQKQQKNKRASEKKKNKKNISIPKQQTCYRIMETKI